MSLAELIAKKKQEIAAKKASNLKPLKPQPGKHKYRILPGNFAGNKEQFWHEFGMHYIKTKEGGKPEVVHICNEKTYGKPCEICEMVGQAYRNAETDAQRNFIKENFANEGYLVNVLHLTGTEPQKPQVMLIGSGIFEDFLEIYEEYGDFTNIETGVDIIITREGTGKNDTSYTVMPSRTSEPVTPSILENIVNLDAVVAQEDETRRLEAIKKLETLSRTKSAESYLEADPAERSKPIGLSKLGDVDDVPDFDDVPLNSVTPEDVPVGASGGSVMSDDELDDLLGDLETA